MRDQTPSRPTRGDYLCSLLTLVVEVLAASLVWEGKAGWGLLVHGAALAVAGAFLVRQARARSSVGVAGMLFIATAGAGPFGAFGTCLAVAVMAVSRSESGTAEWFAALFPEAAHSDLEKTASSARAEVSEEADGEVLPLIDLLDNGDELQKQSVVALVARSFRPSLAALLRRSLLDSSNGVRVQAATALTRIESRFTEQAVELRSQIASGDGGAKLRLARLYDDYAYTGLLDPEREQQNRADALQLYQEHLGENPSDGMAKRAVARLLIRQGRYGEAEPWLGELRDAGGGVESALWRMEVAFGLGRWDEVRALTAANAERLEQDTEATPALREVIALWQGVSL